MSAHKISASQSHVSEQVFSPEQSSTEDITSSDCTITLRRFEGPVGTELFFSCRPLHQPKATEAQTHELYNAIRDLLASEGGNLDSIISETIFIRDTKKDITSIRKIRSRFFPNHSTNSVRHALTEIQQPPLNTNANLEIAIQAFVPHESSNLPTRKQTVQARSNCPCEGCKTPTAINIELEHESRLIAGTLSGNGDDTYKQTLSMFELAEKLLKEAGMDFKDVVRTWIYLRKMERDYYPGLNKARREFFDSRDIDPVPASTGIEGGMVSDNHDISMGFYAVKSDKPLMRSVMTTPTLNEAGEYGADFTRGMRVTEANKIALHVSGTASINEQGLTVHLNDSSAQIDRMILNIKTLLENQGASFQDIAYAYNYLKDPADEQLLKRKFSEAGFEGFPSIFVHAEVCRPDLLCETEVFAVLPINKPSNAKPTLVGK